eukprot:Hpha_TRINITY_DN15702_c7_g3::TRINITY_DN15702_c7_g3_i1::g.37935::m.37935
MTSLSQADAAAVAYARERLLPAYFESLIRDCLRHRPEGRANVLRHLRNFAQRRLNDGKRPSAGGGSHRGRHRIGDTKWEVTGVIASGNTSWFGGGGAVINVRRGLDTTTGEEVAIKVFQKNKIEKNQTWNTVVLLIRKMMQLHHPHVVKIKDVKHTDRRVYLVMELAPGRVEKLMERHPGGCLPEAQCRKFMRQLVSAVSYIHAKGGAHGDINLSLFLTSVTDDLKLSNGGTTVLGLGLSTGGPSRATWGYAAPEVFEERLSTEVQQRGDVWSCGVCLFEMLTGELPFQAAEDSKLIAMISRGEMGPAARRLPAGAKDLLKKIFVHMDQRPTVEELMRHPWLCDGENNWWEDEALKSSATDPPPSAATEGRASILSTGYIPDLTPDQVGTNPVSSSQGFEKKEEAGLEEALAQQADFTEDVDESDDSDSDSSGGGGTKPVFKNMMGLNSGKRKAAAVTAFRNLVPQQLDFESEIDRVAEGQEELLDLAGMKLSVLPDLARLASHLKCLHLASNDLVELPEAIGELALLEELKLRQNKLRTLPEAIGQLTNLRVLFADDNLLSELPVEMAHLSELEEVGLDWNQFTELPAVLLAGGALKDLHMVSNPLDRETCLPPADCFADLQNVLTLRVHNAPWIIKQVDAVKDDPESGGKLKVEWTKLYPDKVLDFLYLGPLSCCQDPTVYEELGIGYIASIGRELSVVCGKTEQIQINVDDVPGTDLVPCFDFVHEFIDKAKDAGSAVLVHCFKGQSRSATLVCTYLMKKRRITRDEAISFVKQYRPCINPNPGFMTQMLAYEQHLGLTE